MLLQCRSLGDLLLGGLRNLGDADGRAAFFAGIGPARFRGAALVVIEPRTAQLGPERLSQGVGAHAILPHRALEGLQGRSGT